MAGVQGDLGGRSTCCLPAMFPDPQRRIQEWKGVRIQVQWAQPAAVCSIHFVSNLTLH